MREEYPKRLLRKKQEATSGGESYDDLTFGPIPNGEQWYVRNIVATDEDNSITKVGVAIRHNEQLYWINERTFTIAALRRRLPRCFWAREAEEIVVRVTGATNGDTLKAWLIGEYEEIGELVGAPTRFGEM